MEKEIIVKEIVKALELFSDKIRDEMQEMGS
ncbi:hypothetical protein LR68_03760 [Anoxybacillus sp. BCO1]|nr:hypothetical protein LR68_03760 [Anoxybacillus sp. BCO1]